MVLESQGDVSVKFQKSGLRNRSYVNTSYLYYNFLLSVFKQIFTAHLLSTRNRGSKVCRTSTISVSVEPVIQE